MQRYQSCQEIRQQELRSEADKTIHYQWYGNYFYNANGTFEAGWYNEREGLEKDVTWTGEHTEETLTADLIIATGDDLISKEKKLSVKARKLISTSVCSGVGKAQTIPHA